ncbi:hypothetical protein BDN70DRAFT_880077 [Pholiota conissans]|uniref:Uncharacterized protein n=1 Tax=Pholiota conissans TaxID=109636 RepID=A0A9P5YZZ9_9AGAR|nr:hypothetical protein BDN70DRAFT_880077 [Pholiota conissans]
MELFACSFRVLFLPLPASRDLIPGYTGCITTLWILEYCRRTERVSANVETRPRDSLLSGDRLKKVGRLYPVRCVSFHCCTVSLALMTVESNNATPD